MSNPAVTQTTKVVLTDEQMEKLNNMADVLEKISGIKEVKVPLFSMYPTIMITVSVALKSNYIKKGYVPTIEIKSIGLGQKEVETSAEESEVFRMMAEVLCRSHDYKNLHYFRYLIDNNDIIKELKSYSILFHHLLWKLTNKLNCRPEEILELTSAITMANRSEKALLKQKEKEVHAQS